MLENEERPGDEFEDEEDLEDIDDDDDQELPSDDEDDEGALEDLLTPRPGGRRAEGESDEDAEDIMSFVPEPDLPKNVDPPPAKLRPVKAQEFVCNNCRLVKKRSQLADASRTLCRDCV